MSKLEDVRPNAAIRGILPDSLVTVVSVQWFGSDALGSADPFSAFVRSGIGRSYLDGRAPAPSNHRRL